MSCNWQGLEATIQSGSREKYTYSEIQLGFWQPHRSLRKNARVRVCDQAATWST